MIRHWIPASMFDSLAEGNGGANALAHLAAAEYSKNLLLLHGVVAMARETAHPEHGRARDAYDLLASVQDRAPGAVDAVLRYPSVGAWAGRTLLALRERRTLAGPASLAAVAAAAAIRARYPCAIKVPVADGMVMLPSLGQAIVPSRGASAVLRSRPDGAELVAGKSCLLIPDDLYADAFGWRGLRRFRARSGSAVLRLIIDDLDPCRMPATSPSSRLTDAEARHLQSAVRGAWDILRVNHPAVAEEIAAAVTVLVPLQSLGHGMRSATSRENFGCVGVSVPPGALPLALSLAHEVQHTKLHAVQAVVRLIRPDDGRRYYAPWREDPRPASGLLQGAYAYLGVARFWRRQRSMEGGARALRAHAEYARWRSAVLAASGDLLRSDRLTAAGSDFVSRMAAVADAWLYDPVPAAAMDIASREATRHRERWRSRHGSIR